VIEFLSFFMLQLALDWSKAKPKGWREEELSSPLDYRELLNALWFSNIHNNRV